MHFQRSKDVLDVFIKTRRDSDLEDIDKAKNAGFRVHDQDIVIYEQKKLGLCAYYDKRCVLVDSVHTRLLGFRPL